MEAGHRESDYSDQWEEERKWSSDQANRNSEMENNPFQGHIIVSATAQK
jgi:hypothetical protein